MLFCASSLLFVGFLFWQTTLFMDRQVDAILRSEMAALIGPMRDGKDDLPAIVDRMRQRVLIPGDDQLSYLLLDPAGLTVVSNLRNWGSMDELGNGVVELTTQPGDERPERIIRLKEAELEDGHKLYVGLDVVEELSMQELIFETLASGIFFMVVISGVGALVFRRAVAQRLQEVNSTCEEIMTGDLTRRVPTTGAGDEFDHLAHNLNRMLDEINYLMESKRNMPNTIAHDLRRPLTRLKSTLEAIATHREADGDTIRTTIAGTIGELDEIIALFNALLRISRIESGAGREHFGVVQCERIVHEVAELYQPLAEEKMITLTAETDEGLRVVGDSHLLSQAFANLVDNAIKYTPKGGTITLWAARVDTIIDMAVADSGPGIPAEHRPMITRRFYRLDKSRSTPGHGLGLTLVSAVTKLHGGRLVFEDNEPGLLARMLLPLHRPQRISVLKG